MDVIDSRRSLRIRGVERDIEGGAVEYSTGYPSGEYPLGGRRL